jgi:hypothetical protein
MVKHQLGGIGIRRFAEDYQSIQKTSDYDA